MRIAKTDSIGNKTFNYLTAIEPDNERQGRTKFWYFKCVCGELKSLDAYAVMRGDTKSCGCQRLRLAGASNVTHGMKGTPEYDAWRGCKKRCTPGNKDYERYKDRAPIGDFSFEAFYKDIGPRPGSEYSVDRKDNDKPYQVGNLKWSTLIEQANNRKDNILVAWQGETMSLKRACETAGISYMKALQRYWATQDMNHSSDGLFVLVSGGRHEK